MRPVSLLCCALAAALGCAAPQPAPTTESTGGGSAGAVERGVLGFVYEGDTTVIEEYTRTADVLEGVVRPQIRGAKFGWARYRVEFGPSGDAKRAELALGPYGTGPKSAPRTTWTVTIGDSEIVEVSTAGTTRRVPAAGVIMPLFAPSMAMFHEVIRRTHRLGATRGRTKVLIYPLASNGQPHSVTVAWVARDTVTVSYHVDGPPTYYAVDSRGRVLSARDPTGRRHPVVRLR
jgi:hypothetical protein